MLVLILCLFRGGGGGFCQPVVDGGCLLLVLKCFPECPVEWGLFVYLASQGVGRSGVGLSGGVCLFNPLLVAH